MFRNLSPIYLVFIITITSIKCDFTWINWNMSTNRGNSHLEREYKFPMFQKVSPSTCDLTDSCDVFCCEDPDCDEAQKQNFKCSESRDNTLPHFDCNSDYFDKPEWMFWFCYVFKNPIYLGKFYTTPKKIEKIRVLRSMIGDKRKNLGKYEALKSKTMMQYGSSIMTFSPLIDLFPSVGPLLMKTPIRDSSYACISKPVKYQIKGITLCLNKITPYLCQHSQALSVLPFLIQNTTMSVNNITPVVLKRLDFLEGIETEVQIKCFKSKVTTHKFKERKLLVFQKASICEEAIGNYQTEWNKPVCKNVLAYVHHHFTVNGSNLVKLNVEYGVMNISLPSDIVKEFSNGLHNQYIYAEQVFNISFNNMNNIYYNNQNYSENDDLYSRGYFVGEELNFGFKSIENSTEIWRKHFIGVFKNGRSCENLSPVTFGFDSLSSCKILTKFSNCSKLRIEIEKKFDNLVQGERMASYSNLRSPFNATTPLLRNYFNSSSEIFTNSSHCSVPVLQDLLIQYTTLLTKNGIPIYRIIGARVDRTYKNLTVGGDVSLSSRVLYFCVSYSIDKPMSRFWTRMFSPELSENSWLSIFNAFEDVNAVEQEEITFWCTILMVSVSGVVVFKNFNINLDFFFL